MKGDDESLKEFVGVELERLDLSVGGREDEFDDWRGEGNGREGMEGKDGGFSGGVFGWTS